MAIPNHPVFLAVCIDGSSMNRLDGKENLSGLFYSKSIAYSRVARVIVLLMHISIPKNRGHRGDAILSVGTKFPTIFPHFTPNLAFVFG